MVDGVGIDAAAAGKKGAVVSTDVRFVSVTLPRMKTELLPTTVLNVLANILALMATASVLSAQPISAEPRPAYGIFGDVSLNIHEAEFTNLPGIPSCCPRYESGTGLGPSVGLFYELPTGGQTLLYLRAGYFSHSATLATTEQTTVIVGNEARDGKFEHRIDASLASVAIEPLFGVRPASALTLHIGGRLGAVIAKQFSQQETIVKPEDVGVFENGRRTRNDTTAEIPNASATEAAAVAGISYQLPLNRQRTLFLQPELFFSLGLLNVATDVDWNTGGIRFGVALKYRPATEPTIAATIPDSPTETEPTPPGAESPAAGPALAAAIVAAGVDHDGTERPVASIRTEEFIATSLRPLLNYLFFDENSSTIPERYARIPAEMTEQFQIERLYNLETLPTYYHLLNIIGRRLRQHPEARITITGCSPEQPVQPNADGLATRRAESVREYLTQVWGIASGRMSIAALTMPEKPSNPTELDAELDGIAENRRVEITASIPQILEPVVTTDTIRTINPPVVRFRPTVVAESGVLNWQVRATQQGKLLRQFGGIGSPPALLDWNIEQEQHTVPRSNATLKYQLLVEDLKGEKRLAEGELSVEELTVQKKRTQRIADREIDRYSLILFDFDRAELNDANRRISEFIRERITPAATVTITGYTDRIGQEEYNQQLSAQRAQATAQALGARPDQAAGQGETTTLFNNDLPEGRFYSRTVTVVVEAPVK